MTSVFTRQGWRLLAACRDSIDPDVFSITTSPIIVEQARAICAWCPLDVRRACLEEGREFGDDHTVRAGLTPSQRRGLPRSRQDAMIIEPARFVGSGGTKQRIKEMEDLDD